MSLLQAEQLAKSYNGRQVVKSVSLEVKAGTIVGLLGPNGAGKTTSFYMIVGLVPSDKGTIKIDDEDISYDAYNNSKILIFSDFDRLFDIAIKKLGTNQSQYDIFGHSAGGQIAHRLALFKPNTKVNRILASNSGSYTAPVFETKLPFGIQDAKLSDEHLKHAFKEKLTLFIGELDNENGTGGTLLHSPTVNKQGLHRYARAQYFYKTAKKAAKNLNTPINWQLKIIPNIGHNYRLMGKAAAEHLYANL